MPISSTAKTTMTIRTIIKVMETLSRTNGLYVAYAYG